MRYDEFGDGDNNSSMRSYLRTMDNVTHDMFIKDEVFVLGDSLDINYPGKIRGISCQAGESQLDIIWPER